MATSVFLEDYLGRDLVTPDSNVKDFIGRLATSTVDYMGRPLVRILRVNNAVVTLGQLLRFSGGSEYVVKQAGTLAGSPPSPPLVGADVTDGTAVLTRTV